MCRGARSRMSGSPTASAAIRMPVHQSVSVSSRSNAIALQHPRGCCHTRFACSRGATSPCWQREGSGSWRSVERDRHALYEACAPASIGEPAADTLMELLPPVGWADVATKTDVDAGLNALYNRIEALVYRELLREVGGLHAEIGSIRDEIQRHDPDDPGLDGRNSGVGGRAGPRHRASCPTNCLRVALLFGHDPNTCSLSVCGVRLRVAQVARPLPRLRRMGHLRRADDR